MKHFFSILSILLLSLIAYSQEYDLIFYCTGFTYDYIGRLKTIDNGKEVYLFESFHQTEVKHLKRIDSLLKKHNVDNPPVTYKIIRRDSMQSCINCNEFYNLMSEGLVNKVNEFYRFKLISSSISNDQKYVGKIKSCKILGASQQQQLSFIAGCFYSHGKHDSLGYFIQFDNSHLKMKIYRKLLKRYKCKIIKEFNNQVKGLAIAPYIETIYFEPSVKIKEIIDHEIKFQ